MISFNKIFLWQKIDNLRRKIIHMLSAVAIFFFPYFFSLNQIIFLSLLFAFLFSLARFFDFLPIINKVKRISLGEVFYPLGVMLAAIIFLPHEVMAFQFGILVLGFSDALANIFGDLFGIHRFKILGGAKSLEGSSVFFFSTFILFFLFRFPFSFLDLSVYLIMSLALTLVELLLFFGLDNLILPSLAAYFSSPSPTKNGATS